MDAASLEKWMDAHQATALFGGVCGLITMAVFLWVRRGYHAKGIMKWMVASQFPILGFFLGFMLPMWALVGVAIAACLAIFGLFRLTAPLETYDRLIAWRAWLKEIESKKQITQEQSAIYDEVKRVLDGQADFLADMQRRFPDRPVRTELYPN